MVTVPVEGVVAPQKRSDHREKSHRKSVVGGIEA